MNNFNNRFKVIYDEPLYITDEIKNDNPKILNVLYKYLKLRYPGCRVSNGGDNAYAVYCNRYIDGINTPYLYFDPIIKDYNNNKFLYARIFKNDGDDKWDAHSQPLALISNRDKIASYKDPPMITPEKLINNKYNFTERIKKVFNEIHYNKSELDDIISELRNIDKVSNIKILNNENKYLDHIEIWIYFNTHNNFELKSIYNDIKNIINNKKLSGYWCDMLWNDSSTPSLALCWYEN